jgi:hypothetical protein
MDRAAIIKRRRSEARAISREDFAQIGQPHISAMLRDQLGDAQPAARPSPFEHATSSIDSQSAISQSVTAPLLCNPA